MRRGLLTSILLSTVFALIIGAPGCVTMVGDPLQGQAKRTDNLTTPVGSATSLRVTTDVGAIKLDAAQTAEVHITAEITVKAKTDEAAQALLERVRVDAERSGDTLVVKAEKPSGFDRSQLEVDFTIAAPAELRLDCTTNVGDIGVDGFHGRMEARTNVGSIECSGLRDSINLRTNVGDIQVAYAADAPPALNVHAFADVGNIDFAGPSQISARLTAAADVGQIRTERPITVTGLLGKTVRVSFGAAEGEVDLETDVGSITIR